MSSKNHNISEAKLSSLATALGVPVSVLIADCQQTRYGRPAKESPSLPLQSIGEALLADARGDHQRALALLEGVATQKLDGISAVVYRIAVARASANLGHLERAEQLLEGNLLFLQTEAQSPLLVARCAFELAMIQARRQKLFDAIEGLCQAENTLIAIGPQAAGHLFLVREFFMGIALRSGHFEHALRLSMESLACTTSLETSGQRGLSALDEALVAALQAKIP